MRKILKPLLFAEFAVIIGCAVATALSMTMAAEFIANYRIICTICMITTILFFGTVVAIEFWVNQNPMPFRIVRTIMAAFVLLLGLSLCLWILRPAVTNSEILGTAYLQLLTWLGILPVIMGAVIFFKIPQSPPKTD